MDVKNVSVETLNECIKVLNERHDDHGDAQLCFEGIAALWNAYLNNHQEGGDLTSVDVVNMMVLFKVGRNMTGKYHKDNWVDICGYGALGNEIATNNIIKFEEV